MGNRYKRSTNCPNPKEDPSVLWMFSRPLPTEILKEIFLYVRAEGGTFKDRREYDWLGITLVCHQWRDISLSCPGLWTLVSTAYGVKVIRKLLKLSKCEHLTAVIRPARKGQTTYSRDKAFDLIKSLLGSVDELILIYDSKFKPMLRISPESMLAIRTLKIFGEGPQGERDGPQVPARMFECCMENLQTLWINVPFDSWSSPLFTSLTSIEINQTPFKAVAKPSYEQLWNVLENCPDLQLLSLIGCLPRDRDERTVRQAAVRRRISLPYLTHFRVKVSTIQAATLLTSVLDIPRWTIRYFSLSLNPPTSPETDLSFWDMNDGRLLAQGMRGTDREIKRRTLRIEIFGHKVKMRLTTTFWDLDEEYSGELDVYSFKGVTPSHIAHVLHLLKWDDVADLEIDISSDFSNSEHVDTCDVTDLKGCTEWCYWRAIFGCLTALESLIVKIKGHKDNMGDFMEHYAWTIIRALNNEVYICPKLIYPLDFLALSKDVRDRVKGLFDEDKDGNSSSETLCPQLRQLTIESDEISRLAPRNDEKEFWTLLNVFLSCRNGDGYRITKLTLRRTNKEVEEDSEIKWARGLVDEVELDF